MSGSEAAVGRARDARPRGPRAARGLWRPGNLSTLEHCTEKATRPYRGSRAGEMAIEAGDRLFRIGMPIASAIKSRGPVDISTIT